MENELAKYLKEAGFPQDIYAEHYRFIADESGGRVFVPILEELIEACGEHFYALQNEGHSWEAKCYKVDHLPNNYAAGGATPTEAVARLYIALNKK